MYRRSIDAGADAGRRITLGTDMCQPCTLLGRSQTNSAKAPGHEMWRSPVKKVEADAVIKDALARGKILQAKVLREAGGLVSDSEAAGLLGVTKQEL